MNYIILHLRGHDDGEHKWTRLLEIGRIGTPCLPQLGHWVNWGSDFRSSVMRQSIQLYSGLDKVGARFPGSHSETPEGEARDTNAWRSSHVKASASMVGFYGAARVQALPALVMPGVNVNLALPVVLVGTSAGGPSSLLLLQQLVRMGVPVLAVLLADPAFTRGWQDGWLDSVPIGLDRVTYKKNWHRNHDKISDAKDDERYCPVPGFENYCITHTDDHGDAYHYAHKQIIGFLDELDRRG